MQICEICAASLSNITNLNKHKRQVHKIIPEVKNGQYFCVCGKCFSSNSTLNRHKRTFHGMKPPQRKKKAETACPKCERKFSGTSVLYRHIRRMHGLEPCLDEPHKLLCPLCYESLQNFGKLDEHLKYDHAVALEVQTLHFQTLDEFTEWKRGLEEETMAFFTIRSSGEGKTYYRCFRSEKQGEGSRLNCRSSFKINSCCPARMILTAREGKIKVVFQKVHVGHTVKMHTNNKQDLQVSHDTKTSSYEIDSADFMQTVEDILPIHVHRSVGDLNLLDKLKDCMETVLGLAVCIPSNSLPQLCNEAEKLVDMAKELVMPGSNSVNEDEMVHFSPSSPIPENKNIEKPRSFRSIEDQLGKSTNNETRPETLQEAMLNQEREILYISTGFDHAYVSSFSNSN